MLALSDEAATISEAIHELERSKSPAQPRQFDIEDGQPSNGVRTESVQSETESKLDVCERCKAPSDIVAKFEETQQSLIKVTDEIKSYKIQQVETLKTTNHSEAAKTYVELCTLEKQTMESHKAKADDNAANESEAKYLKYRYELVEMLQKLGRNEEGLRIAKETWQRRAKLDNLGAETKRSHQQYCLLLQALGMFTEAKEQYRKVCSNEMESDPEWAITSGFQLGLLFIEYGFREEAALKHWRMYEVCKTRLSLSTNLAIEIAEQIVRREEELEREDRGHPGRMDEVLRDVWAARTTHLSIKLLALGHKLGVRLYNSKSYTEASSVLEVVWAGRKSQLKEDSQETLSSADFLFKSYFDSEKYGAGARVAQWIAKRRDKLSKYDPETISAFHSLGTAFSRINSHVDAELAFKESWQRWKTVLVDDDLLTLESGWEYGDVLAKLNKTLEAEDVFKEVWRNAKVRLNQPSGIESERSVLFSYGTRLAAFCEGQGSPAKYKAAREVYQDLLDLVKEEPLSAETLRYAYRSAKCQYKREYYEDAVKELSNVWDRRESVWGEDSEDLLETGFYLCRAMLKARTANYRRAKRVIDEVIEKAHVKYGTSSNVVARYEKIKERIPVRGK